MEPLNDSVAMYCSAYYFDPDTSTCTLCGNSGVIDTRLTAVSSTGNPVGCLNWCLCSVGQCFRKHREGSAPVDRDLTFLFDKTARKLLKESKS